MKKNDKITATCLNYTNEGFGVVKVDGFPLFVKGMLQGEEGVIVVTMVKKTYGYGRLLELTRTSPYRVKQPCAIAKQCGGCQLQHMKYEEQLRLKKQKVQDVIQRIAKLDLTVEDVIGMEKHTHYRNKGQIPVGLHNDQVVTGFYRINSNTIIDTDTCMIQSEQINEVLKTMRTLLKNYGNAKYFRHLLIKHAFVSGQVMVVWIVRSKDFPHRDEMMKELTTAIPAIETVVINVNTRQDNVILGDEEHVLYGTGKIQDAIHDLKFHISSKSFYQVNPVQTEVLYGKAMEYCDLQGTETVIDLYCGVGTISMFLAQKAKKVIGIEIVPAAIADAKENAKANNIQNIEFICSDAASYAMKINEQNMHPDVVVVDPPRKGCDEQTIESIVQMNPSRVVYVSCDPGTLARDLKAFEAQGYTAVKIQPVDMFPFTFHIENVTLLVKKQKYK